MVPLFYSWVGVTIVLLVLLIVRRRLEAHEQDWLPISTTTAADIQRQEMIEKKVHRLTPIVRWVGAIDVLLLAALTALWLYRGIQTVRF